VKESKQNAICSIMSNTFSQIRCITPSNWCIKISALSKLKEKHNYLFENISIYFRLDFSSSYNDQLPDCRIYSSRLSKIYHWKLTTVRLLNSPIISSRRQNTQTLSCI
jgi:hypothetical protein